uniref:Retrotransposon protein, putative, Ty3-gypsy subclass n=2 Tax=Oryza sativa subsp. japonica TaxID=39947 RepID=Q84T34_ORYSJ|nr:hypothetical protein [Oryza sativa Japonica Group]ABF96934.1 retrotransposon protein, putative, Ty3-gypsy subclass [Oryza sativa Japonica Group]
MDISEANEGYVSCGSVIEMSRQMKAARAGQARVHKRQLLTYRPTSYKKYKRLQMQRERLKRAKPGSLTSAAGHSTPQANLDGSDETNLSETAPTEKNFNSGVGEKRARLSTTHCTQQVIPEEELDNRTPRLTQLHHAHPRHRCLGKGRAILQIKQLPTPACGKHGLTSSKGGADRWGPWAVAQGGRSTVDRDHAGGPPPVHGTDGPDRPGGRSDGTAAARHGSARLQNRPAGHGNRRRRARSPATAIGGVGSDSGRGTGRRRRPKATASAWREAAQTRERGRGRRGGSSPASMAAGAEDEGGGDDLAMRRGGRVAAAPTEEGVEKD